MTPPVPDAEQGPPGRRPEWVDPALYPFTDRWLWVGGARMHYVDEGDGPVLLLLHGNPTWSFLYRHLIRALSAQWRCVAVDYPGFGLSETPPGYGHTVAEHAAAVQALVEFLELGEITVMGQDWGGPIGLALAGRAPERARGLVLGNTFAWPVNGDPWFEGFSRAWSNPAGRLAVERGNAFVNAVIPAGTWRTLPPAAVMRHYRRPLPDGAARRPTWVFPRELLTAKRFLAEVEAGLAGLADRPALLAWGTRDPAFGAKQRHRFERAFPRARSVLLHGASHFIQEDAPGQLAEAITAWSGTG